MDYSDEGWGTEITGVGATGGRLTLIAPTLVAQSRPSLPSVVLR
jgi:hypothetical protein